MRGSLRFLDGDGELRWLADLSTCLVTFSSDSTGNDIDNGKGKLGFVTSIESFVLNKYYHMSENEK